VSLNYIFENMEQLLIEVNSEDTSAAIKEFLSRFSDASVSVRKVYDDSFYTENYGINKTTSEQSLNIGLAQSILGITKP